MSLLFLVGLLLLDSFTLSLPPLKALCQIYFWQIFVLPFWTDAGSALPSSLIAMRGKTLSNF